MAKKANNPSASFAQTAAQRKEIFNQISSGVDYATAKKLEMRNKFNVLRVQLEIKRSTFRTHWLDIADHIRPRRARFLITDVDMGSKRNQFIVDGTATRASRTLRSGMMSGVSSPSRQWFRLTTHEADLMEDEDIQEWLYSITERMQVILSRSNFYSAMPILYGDAGDFGTGVVFVEEDFEKTIRFYPLPIGSYSISNNELLITDTIIRDFRMSIRQIVEKFGKDDQTGKINWENISPWVKSQWEAGVYEAWVDVTHLILPNDDYNPKKIGSKNKRYLSCYYERGGTGVPMDGTTNTNFEVALDRFLSIKGYDSFRALVFKWEVTGEDDYGTSCPGMDALGDIRELQIVRRKKMQAINKQVDPPMVASTSMKNQKTSILPGDITYLDSMGANIGFKPAYEVKFDISGVENAQKELRDSIKEHYFADLFLMMAEDDRREPATATEVNERHEEKLLALGPVMENLNEGVFDPLFNLLFNFMARQGQIPPVPDSLKGKDIHVEYMSIMAQAQKLLGISSMERLSGFVGNIAQMSPDALDNIDVDEAIDVYAKMLSVPPQVIRTADKVTAIRKQKAQQQAQQQKMAQAQQMAGTAKDLSSADTSGDNALTRMMQSAQAGNLVPTK